MKKSNFFWVGFADLMSSLFFIILILFIVTVLILENKMAENVEIIAESADVISDNKKIIIENKKIITENDKLIAKLKIKEKELNIENERLSKLLKIEEQFKPLEENKNFVYLKDCKKFVASKLIGKEIFEPTKTSIKKDFKEVTLQAGRSLEAFLSKLKKENPSLSYLLVIEGNMANKYDKSIDKDNLWGYQKSYLRALAVYQLWQSNSIDFRKFNVEVMICGSGFNGLCRDKDEENNKRFSIQIIPKTENTNIYSKE